MPRQGLLMALAALTAWPCRSEARQAPSGIQAVVSELAGRVVTHGDLTVSRIDLGEVRVGANRFRARITNGGAAEVTLGLTVRTVPGLWLRGNWQRGYRFDVPPDSTVEIEAEYQVVRMTPESTLRFAFGRPRTVGDGISVEDRWYDTTLVVGAGNPAATDPRLAFDTASTEHFEVYGWKVPTGTGRLRTVAAAREQALRRIAELLGVVFTGRIRLVLYPDSATKTSQTGHIGAGFASGRTIVEIFNDSVQLDPYHEVAHIVGGELGSPPAMLEEGFAVYASELLGADALEYLGSPGMSVAEAVCAARAEHALFPLARLSRFGEIGSDSTVPRISYPQAASLTGWLIRQYGLEKFRALYARLRSRGDPGDAPHNDAVLRELYGVSVQELEESWTAGLRCAP